MRKLLTLGAVLGLFTAFAASAVADTAPPPASPFPASKVGTVFVAAQTATKTGVMSSWFAPGTTVVFRAYAVDTKTDKIIAKQNVKFFYATIPGQKNVKFTYDPTSPGATNRMAWTAQWAVPTTYPAGIVNFKILVQTKDKHRGSFVQMPVATAQLNISSTAPALAPTGPASAGTPPASQTLALYVDSVNGTAPPGAPTRPIGCTQTNVYKRGERIVIRTWGFDLKTGDTLSTDNVDTATYTIPGVAPIQLAYGAHGATGNKIWFWSNFFIIPADFPLGDVTVHVAFKTDSGETGSYDYPITITP